MYDKEILSLLQRDLREPFIETMFDTLRGTYAAAYDDISQPPGGFVIQRPNAEWDPVDLQAVRDGRRDNGMKALMRSCSTTNTVSTVMIMSNHSTTTNKLYIQQQQQAKQNKIRILQNVLPLLFHSRYIINARHYLHYQLLCHSVPTKIRQFAFF